MTIPSEGWAVELAGHEFDLRTAKDELRPPFDPWVEPFKTPEGKAVLLLRSSEWKELGSGHDVLRHAHQLITELNGAYRLHAHDAEALTAVDVHKFDEVGRRVPVLVALSGSVSLKGGRMFGHISRAPSDYDRPSVLQKLVGLARVQEDYADLLVFLSRCDNWYDLYKVTEMVAKIVGGGRREVITLLGAAGKEWDRACQTANHYRHAPSLQYPLPPDPPSFDVAQDFVLKAARKLISTFDR